MGTQRKGTEGVHPAANAFSRVQLSANPTSPQLQTFTPNLNDSQVRRTKDKPALGIPGLPLSRKSSLLTMLQPRSITLWAILSGAIVLFFFFHLPNRNRLSLSSYSVGPLLHPQSTSLLGSITNKGRTNSFPSRAHLSKPLASPTTRSASRRSSQSVYRSAATKEMPWL